MFLKKSSIFVMLSILATASQAHAEVIISPDGSQVRAGEVTVNDGSVNISRRRTRAKKYDRYGRLIQTTFPQIKRSTNRAEDYSDDEYSDRQVIRSTRSTGNVRSTTTVQSTTVRGRNRTVTQSSTQSNTSY
jgi:hypothetical protein